MPEVLAASPFLILIVGFAMFCVVWALWQMHGYDIGVGPFSFGTSTFIDPAVDGVTTALNEMIFVLLFGLSGVDAGVGTNIIQNGGTPLDAAQNLFEQVLNVGGELVRSGLRDLFNYAYDFDIAATVEGIQDTLNVNVIVNAGINTITQNTLAETQATVGLLESLTQQDISAIQNSITRLSDATNYLASSLVTIQGDITAEGQVVLPFLEQVSVNLAERVISLETEFSAEEAGFNFLASAIVSIEQRIETGFPLLDTLEGLVTDVGNSIDSLTNALGGIAGATLLGVLVATGIDTLIKLADDPCFCFNEGGDLEFLIPLVGLIAAETL